MGYGDAAGSVCLSARSQKCEAQICVSMPDLHGVFEQADLLLQDRLEQPLPISTAPGISRPRTRQQAELNATQVAQPALGVVDLAAFDLLKPFGVQPDFVAGHSYGEYAALCAAGVISRDDLIRLSEARGRLAAEAVSQHPSAMAAVQVDAETTSSALRQLKLPVSLASLNAPDQTIIGGPVNTIEQAVTALGQMGLAAKQIPVTAAFHTEAMAPAAKALGTQLEKIKLHTATVPVFSNTLAAPYPQAPEAIRDVLTRHLVEPLRFAEQVRAMHQAGARVFIEAGPGQILSGLVRRTLADHPHTCLAIDTARRSGWAQLAHLLAQALVWGAMAVRGRRLTADRPEQLSDQAHVRANPASTIWRVDCAKAVPWQEPPVASSTPAQTSTLSEPTTPAADPSTTETIARAAA